MNDNGIRRRDGAVPSCRASPIASVMSTITTGVSLRNAEANAAVPKKASSERPACRTESRESPAICASSTPVRTSAAERMNIAPIVPGAGFASAARTFSV